jgi:hypothetical protein
MPARDSQVCLHAAVTKMAAIVKICNNVDTRPALMTDFEEMAYNERLVEYQLH